MRLPSEVVDLLNSPIISSGVGRKDEGTSQNSCAVDTDEENTNEDMTVLKLN